MKRKIITRKEFDLSPCCPVGTPCSPEGNVSRRRFLVAASTLVAGLAAGPALAASDRKTYADLVKGNKSLSGYWRFDGDLSDSLGKFSAEGSANFQFVKGAVDGQALSLSPKLNVAVPNAKPVGRGASTLELFFKVNAMPDGSYEPVIISQASDKKTSYVVGVKRDLSALTYTQGSTPTTITLPTGKPVELGRWYHLTIVSLHLDLRVYVDGYECALLGGALHFTHTEAQDVVPMTFGAVAKQDRLASEVELDEVAFYESGLTVEEIRDQLKAGGWGTRLEEIGREVDRHQAELAQARAKRQQELLNDPALTARGESKIYQGEYLEAISFTVGGIGAGGIQFDGHAQPAIWQIACNYALPDGPRIEDSFLAIRAQQQGGRAVVRALQTKPVGPFAAMKSLNFTGEYPLATYRFDEPALPVEVELEVFNPLTPMDAKNSAIPCIIYNIKATNHSSVPVKVDFLAAQKNAVGYSDGRPGSRPAFGGNQNRILKDVDSTLLHMTKGGAGQGAGSDMVLMTQATNAAGLAKWDSQETLHRQFSESGSVSGVEASDPSPAGQTLNGALSAPLELAPGESKTITFVLTWSMPKMEQGDRVPEIGVDAAAEGVAKSTWSHSGNMYSNWWSNATEVAGYMRENLTDLTARTRNFHQTLYASNLPHWLLDRLTSQLAVLRSQTCFWAKNGYFGVFEGVGPGSGCCSGNCTHVWHYAQAHARLFPELGRRMRDQDFDNQSPEGRILMRHSHPNSSAADGHFGTLLNAYREHLCSADDTWLKSHWVKIERAMDWAIKTWDPDNDGFMEGLQPNTLDGAYYGCSSWIGSLYLSTLEVGARIADVVPHQPLADAFRRVRASGKQLQNERLWNGEYYIQTPGEKRQDDYFDGCHIDQILGEWWGEQVGVDRNFPRERSKQAMESLLKYNFRANFHEQSLKPRQFVTVDDAGMKMITWPKDPQPVPGMKYGDEVMTGFEYGAGVSMIQNGLLREGLMVIKAIYDRYDGRKRTEGITNMSTGAWGYTGNPFGDDECGKFYGRSLSVWSALLAMQGFEYDGPAGCIGFRPRWQPENHASFFTAAEGYGLFTQVQYKNRIEASIDLREGQLRLTEVVLAVTNGNQPKSVDVKFAGQAFDAGFEVKEGDLKIRFKSPLVLKAGQKLEIQVASA